MEVNISPRQLTDFDLKLVCGNKCKSSSLIQLNQPINHQSGFTLIELMIALALGLLIVAAGLAVFLTSQRSLGLQAGMGELQQNANFGLSLVTYDIRHANLNTTSSQKVNNAALGSGIVFKKENLPSTLHVINNLETEFTTLQNKDIDNTAGTSDRLTIQYIPATNTIFNCEGAEVTNASSRVIVQRYYLAKSPQQMSGEPTAYSLYCDAGSYTNNGSDTTITGLNAGAQQIMQRVDAFKIRFGVKNPAGNLRYMTTNEYNTAMTALLNASECSDKAATKCNNTFLNIVSVEIGILSRSTGSIGAESSLNTQTTFNVAGTTVTLTGDTALNKRYLRQTVTQVVAIRNTLGGL